MARRTLGPASLSAEPTSDISNPVPEWGADFFSDTSVHNCPVLGGWLAIQCLTDAVVDLTGCNWSGSAISAVTLKAGTTISGLFPYIKLASGTVVAYRASQA